MSGVRMNRKSISEVSTFRDLARFTTTYSITISDEDMFYAEDAQAVLEAVRRGFDEARYLLGFRDEEVDDG